MARGALILGCVEYLRTTCPYALFQVEQTTPPPSATRAPLVLFSTRCIPYQGVVSRDNGRRGRHRSVGCGVEPGREALPPEHRRALVLEVVNLPCARVFFPLFRGDRDLELHEVGLVAPARVVRNRQLFDQGVSLSVRWHAIC